MVQIKMSRPFRKYRYKDFGGSLGVYKEGKYAGSVPHEVLYQMVSQTNVIGRVKVLVEDSVINKDPKNKGNGRDPLV